MCLFHRILLKLHAAHLQLITFSVLLTKVIACSPEPHLLYAPGKKHFKVRNCLLEMFFSALASAVFSIELLDMHTAYNFKTFLNAAFEMFRFLSFHFKTILRIQSPRKNPICYSVNISPQSSSVDLSAHTGSSIFVHVYCAVNCIYELKG